MVRQGEAKFARQYGEPPVLAKGGPGYVEIGMKRR